MKLRTPEKKKNNNQWTCQEVTCSYWRRVKGAAESESKPSHQTSEGF